MRTAKEWNAFLEHETDERISLWLPEILDDLAEQEHNVMKAQAAYQRECTMATALGHALAQRIAEREPVPTRPSRIGWMGTSGTDMESHDY